MCSAARACCCREAVIDMGVDSRAALFGGLHAVKWSDQRLGIEYNAIDDGAVVDHMALDIEREGGAFAEGSTDAVFEFLEEKGRFLRGVGIAGVPVFRAHVVSDDTVKMVAAGLG